MEHFGMVVDFGNKRLQWDKVWAPVKKSSGGGHFLLDLCEDPSNMRRELRKPAFAHAPAELSKQGWLLELEDATGDPTTTTTTDDTTTTDKYSKDLAPKVVRNIMYAVDQATATVTRTLQAARKPLSWCRRCWEVYVGIGLASHSVRLCCVEVRQFGL